MGDSLFLGIDLGTTRVKAGVYDLQGNPHSCAVARVPDSQAWREMMLQAIGQCLQEVDSSRVKGLCAGGQGPTLVAIDGEGTWVRPPLTYDDARAAPEAAQIARLLSRPVSVRSSYLPRALWMRDHEPDRYAATRWFVQAWDDIVYQLTDRAVATSPMGIYTPWREQDLAAVGLKPDLFPPLVKTGKVVGGLTRSASEDTGLPVGTPVVAGGNDFLLGSMGIAAASKGVAQSQGGTTSAFTLCWDSPLQGGMIGWCIPSPIEPGLYNAGGPITTGGAALDWLLRSLLHSSADYETSLSGAEGVQAAAQGLLFYPYLAGEELTLGRHVRGMLLGLSLAHTSDHLIRAVLEGVALAGRSILESLLAAGGLVHEVWTYGGQARSDLWNQIKANFWNRPVVTPKVPDAGCLGAAAIAAVGVGEYPSLSVASQSMAQRGQCYLPDPDHAALCDEAYRAYRQIDLQARELSVDLSALRKGSEE